MYHYFDISLSSFAIVDCLVDPDGETDSVVYASRIQIVLCVEVQWLSHMTCTGTYELTGP